jgi:hypothetical protein
MKSFIEDKVKQRNSQEDVVVTEEVRCKHHQ